MCLPEEVRLERDPDHDPVRLFPPDPDGATLHVVSQGAAVGRRADCLVVRPREGNRRRGYLQGVYPTNADGEWVALSLPGDPNVDHDRFDEVVAAWTRTQAAESIVEALAAQGIPAERVRYHTCYGINMGPRVHDLELRHIVDIMLRINVSPAQLVAHDLVNIVERTIALRPHPAVKLFRDAMYASLKDKLPPDVWDYPAE